MSQDDIWLPHPMGPCKFLKLFRVFLRREVGASETEVRNGMYNTLRRFLPTGADVLDFDEDMAAGIGNWQDCGREAAPGIRKRRVTMPMAKLYANDRVMSAGMHKRLIICAVMRTIRETSTTSSSSTSASAATWTAMRSLRMDLEELSKEAATYTLQRATVEDTKPKAFGEVHALSVRWVVQFPPRKSQRPWIHFFPAGSGAPYCRRLAFAGSPHRQGRGFLEAAEAGERLCPKCYTYLREHFTVDDIDVFFDVESLDEAKNAQAKYMENSTGHPP